ncbi:MAG TPA: DMT family transporter [Gammaproteobacteria bacterium]|nr:DMT family transporter [Gammaproteobacteria bacterium]HRA43175.1 DMT family transporter [Gammaproteobacteria bacterium]
MFLTIVLYALFASLFGLSKDTLNYSEPFFLIGSRMLFAGLLLLTHQFFYNRKAFQIKFSHLKSLLLLSFFCIYLTNAAEIWGIQHMVSAKACLIYSLSPFIAAVVAYIVLKETLSKKKWIGLLIGFTGLIPIFMTQSTSEVTSNETGFFSLANVAVLVAVFGTICSVYGWTLLKKVVSEYNYTPLMANGISMTIGGTMALMHSYVTGEAWNPIPVTDFGPFLQNSLLMCLISNIVCYNLYGHLLKRYTATFMSFAGLITPFFASFFGWYFLGETITWHYFASIIVFSIGLTIFYQEELQREKLFVAPETI